MDYFLSTTEDDLDREFANKDKVKKDIMSILLEWGSNLPNAPRAVKEELRRLIHLVGNNQDELDSIASACRNFGILKEKPHVS